MDVRGNGTPMALCMDDLDHTAKGIPLVNQEGPGPMWGGPSRPLNHERRGWRKGRVVWSTPLLGPIAWPDLRSRPHILRGTQRRRMWWWSHVEWATSTPSSRDFNYGNREIISWIFYNSYGYGAQWGYLMMNHNHGASCGALGDLRDQVWSCIRSAGPTVWYIPTILDSVSDLFVVCSYL